VDAVAAITVKNEAVRDFDIVHERSFPCVITPVQDN
jgi:hypothetical protein